VQTSPPMTTADIPVVVVDPVGTITFDQISLPVATIPTDMVRVAFFNPGRDQKKRRIDDAHNRIVQAIVLIGGHPPSERNDQKTDLNKVERLVGLGQLDLDI